MHRARVYTFLLVQGVLLLAALVLPLGLSGSAQSEPAFTLPATTRQALAYLDPANPDFFTLEGEIGRAVPRRILYSPEAELFAVVDAYNALVLIDALTYATRYSLTPVTNAEGGYSIVDFRFSHDGRYLALLTAENVELWDTQTGQRAASLIRPGTPKQLLGPLTFSDRDDVLLFYGEYAAPPALRQSENDSIFYPWVWHLGAARGEVPSTLPGGVTAQLLYDYGLGTALIRDGRLLSVLPSRLQVLDALTLAALAEIPSATYAEDELSLFTSMVQPRDYVSTPGGLLRFDATTLTLGSAADFDRSAGRVIPRGPLFDRLLGNTDISSIQRLVLLDFIQPSTDASGSTAAYVRIERTNGSSSFHLLYGANVVQMIVSPDGETLLTREQRGDEAVVGYDLTTGAERFVIVPSLRDRQRYSRSQQNRVLAFDLTGETFLSDFQRFATATGELIREDLRYSFRFDRFYFGRDPGTMVTISGSEWRVWDIASNTVLRREVMAQHVSAIYDLSPDAHRIAFSTGAGVLVQDFDTNTRYVLPYPTFTTFGLTRQSSFLNPAWTHMVTVYTDHATGMLAPGGALALTTIDQAAPRWLIAGDDLPPVIQSVGWLNDDTVYVSGRTVGDAAHERVFGVDYAPSGLPACLEARFPQQREMLLRLWERRLYFVPSDTLHTLALDLCAAADLTADDVVVTLAVTPTPTATPDLFATLAPNTTPAPAGQPPPCLFDLYPDAVERAAYTALWQEIAADLPPEMQAELTALLCIRVSGQRVRVEGGEAVPGSAAQVMWIDAATGERSTGSLPAPPPAVGFNPAQAIVTIYSTVTGRQPIATLLSPDRQLLAVSNLPGELAIHRLDFDPLRVGIPLTATANAIRTQQRLIYPAVTAGVPIIATIVPQGIGTARPTLTITPSQTLFPTPADAFTPSRAHICQPVLYTPANLPPDYRPTGRIYGTFGDTGIWAIEPEDGARTRDDAAPACGFGLNCNFSPDRAWILAQTFELIYVIRPDSSDTRVLWDLRTPNPLTPFPQNLRWAAPDMLEWNATLRTGATPMVIPVIVRDILNVYPDPALLPETLDLRVNGIPAAVVSRQPGGWWVVVETTYGTGMGYGQRYYLHRLGTDEMIPVAQHPEWSASFRWGSYGERLYYRLNGLSGQQPEVEILLPDGDQRWARTSGMGTVSPAGDQAAYTHSTAAGDVMVVEDVTTGAITTFCLPPMTEARSLLWSPDNRYLTWLADLPDDSEEHLLVLDTQTGSVVDLVRGIFSLITWGQEPGSYGTGAVQTPAPSRDGFPTPTPPGGGGS